MSLLDRFLAWRRERVFRVPRHWQPCSDCGGRGRLWDDNRRFQGFCETCRGTGYVP